MAGPAKRFGIALLGLGRMGEIHARTLLMSPRARLRWIVRHQVEEARRFAETFDSPIQCVAPAHLDTVLQDDSVDAVVVCSPTSQHETVIKAALDAGKAVFSEKPITPDVNSTRACYELAEAKGLPLLCAFHRRFDPSLMAVKSSLVNNESGYLRLLRCSSHDHSPPPMDYVKNSGGIIKDSTIHDLDMALWMSNSPATKVFVQGCAFNPDIRCFTTRYPEAYSNEIEHFLDVLEGSITLKITKNDTLSVMQLAEAASTSAKTGQVVQLKEELK
ncbi:inositol 2-dehydrogenase [Plakobranchus ocellatus]|uniref:Inositol 2-dehydrogenase n=1 Tax=Plakobranchus ocellatus TaxID=259542 RepID=A0AAV3Y0B3_9GAST|nr:inositol 2-dehydrogenase [Plakobranchus ocellatus]